MRQRQMSVSRGKALFPGNLFTTDTSEWPSDKWPPGVLSPDDEPQSQSL